MAKTHTPIQVNDILTTLLINRVYKGFSNKSLPKKEWTHAAHLITALCLIRDLGLSKAEAKMPNMIRAFNEANGGINSDTEGYHHTITIFYLRVLAKYYVAHENYEFPKLCENLLSGPIGAKNYALIYYSKKLLFSKAARKKWVLPDLQSL